MEGSDDSFNCEDQFEFHDIINEDLTKEELAVQCKVKGIRKNASSWKSCQHCDYKTKLGYRLRRHNIGKHQVCIDCDVQLKTKEQVFKHEKKFHSKVIFQCDNQDCEKKFLTKQGVTRHQNFVHLGVARPTSNSKPKPKLKLHTCDICDFSAESHERLQIHNNVKHLGRKDFECTKCDYKCGLPKELRRHIAYYHEHPEKLFHCERCGYKTPNRSKFNRHMKTHQVEGRRYSCKHCSEEFLSQGYLKYHISKTHGDHLKSFKSEANEWKCQSANM